MTSVLLCLGLDGRTPLSRAANVLQEAEALDGVDALKERLLAAPSESIRVVVGAAAGDRVQAIDLGAAAGVPVLVEDPCSLPAATLERLSSGSALAGFRFRHERGISELRTAVARGELGLLWGFRAELLGAAPAPHAAALDLLDAVVSTAGVEIRSAWPLEGDNALALVCSLDHGVAGTVVATSGDGREGDLGFLRVTGSHGHARAGLGEPVLEICHGGAIERRRLARGGAARLLSAFAFDPPDRLRELPGLAVAARLAVAGASLPRTGREDEARCAS